MTFFLKVKPAYSNYIAPTMAHADIIVPRGGDNKVAIQLIVQHVHTQLQLVSMLHLKYNQFYFVHQNLYTYHDFFYNRELKYISQIFFLSVF